MIWKPSLTPVKMYSLLGFFFPCFVYQGSIDDGDPDGVVSSAWWRLPPWVASSRLIFLFLWCTKFECANSQHRPYLHMRWNIRGSHGGFVKELRCWLWHEQKWNWGVIYESSASTLWGEGMWWQKLILEYLWKIYPDARCEQGLWPIDVLFDIWTALNYWKWC